MVQYHALSCNTMQYHALSCNTMQYHAIPCILFNTMQYHAILYKTMQYYAIQCTTMQYHASLITADGAYHCPVGSVMAIFFADMRYLRHSARLLLEPTAKWNTCTGKWLFKPGIVNICRDWRTLSSFSKPQMIWFHISSVSKLQGIGPESDIKDFER